MKNETSKLRNTENRIKIVQEAIELSMKLYSITNNNYYFDLAFEYSENAKSFVLLSEIRSTEAIKFADLPQSVLNRESRLANEISGYEEMIFEANSLDNIDTTLINNLNAKLFELKDQYNNLQDSIELNFPKYFDLKYKTSFISPKEVQRRLERKEALVEYVLSDSILTTFVIDKENINVLTSTVGSDFSDKCLAYFSLLQNQDFNNNVHQTYKNYVTMARLFYKTLVAPVLEITDSREITFIPDGAIMYLPFESFLSEEADPEHINYKDLPYLIYDVSVGYSYSSTLLFSERIRTQLPEKKVLAFAPSYDNLLDRSVPLAWNRQANPDLLMPLPGAREEVSYISRTVPSDVYFDSLATEGTFKALSSNYSILHLAMHTIMDDENPMYSKLAFTRNFNDTTQDNDLFTYEIYNMKLNADMVVLSSCSSGFGKMQKGEGMMSMARGFIYAGCPSIVMTLWQVSDRSSADLMSGFYKNLKKGKSKKNSLRQSKIDYIQSSDKLKSNPYFWSAFLMVGDNSALYEPSPVKILIIVLLAFILLVAIFGYRKRLLKMLKRK